MAKISALVLSLLKTLKRRWKIVLLLSLVLSIAGVVIIRRQNSQKTPIIYVKPENRNLVKTLEVSGILDAEEKASLRFAAGGKVIAVNAKEGESVRKGQVIAAIDQRELQQRLQQDLNSYTQERLSFDQTLDDTKDKAITNEAKRGTQKAQLELQNTVLSVEIRDTAIRQTRLISPFAGILVGAPISTTGIQILATDAFEIINPDTLLFKAAIDEADIASVKTGQSAEVTLDAYPDAPIKTSISYISPRSQQTSSATVFVVKLPLESDPTLSKYRLGMNGDVTITLETRPSVLSIPIDATRQRDGKTFVDVRQGDTFVTREITSGLETDEYLEVISGLTLQDEIVLPETSETTS